MAELIAEVEYTFNKNKPALLVVTPLVPIDNQSVYLEVAKKMGIKVVSVPHGGRPSFEMTDNPAQHSLIWSKEFERVWAIYDTKMHHVGFPKDLLSKLYEIDNMAVLPTSIRNQPEKKRIMLLMNTTDQVYTPLMDINGYQSTMNVIANIPAHLKDKIEIVLKPHPKIGDRVFENYLISGKDNLSIMRDSDIMSVISNIDLVIICHGASTSFFACYFSGKPFIFCDTYNAVMTEVFYLEDHPQNSIVHEIGDIWNRIEKALTDENFLKEIKRENISYFQKIGLTQADPLEQINQVIQKLLN